MPMADPVYPNRLARVSDAQHASPPLITDPERELPEHATASHLGRIPGGRDPNSRLSGAAESVGSALGSAVSTVRHLPAGLQGAKARFTVIRGRKQQEIRTAADEAVVRVRGAVQDIKQDAQDKLEQARVRANQAVHQYPLHVIAGAALVGALMGIGVRVWRDHAS